MCGRFAFYSPAEATAALFGATAPAEVQPRYNIAPTQYVAAIREESDDTRELVMLRCCLLYTSDAADEFCHGWGWGGGGGV